MADVLLHHKGCPALGVELYPGRWAKSCMAYGPLPGPYFFVTVYYPTSRTR